METLFDQYKELNINGSLICLEQVEDIYSYFCYPTNAKAIGFEGSIMYCFIEPYGEMVFACNPDTCADVDRKSTRLNSSHPTTSRMPSSA